MRSKMMDDILRAMESGKVYLALSKYAPRENEEGEPCVYMVALDDGSRMLVAHQDYEEQLQELNLPDISDKPVLPPFSWPPSEIWPSPLP